MPNDDERRHGSPPPVRREIVLTSQFKRDFKREQKGRYRDALRADLQGAVALLAADIPLPRRMADHPLGGEWKDHRDCHLRPDLVLIYRKSSTKAGGADIRPLLSLVRLGSHSELGF